MQNTILEMIARGDGLKETVDYLCLSVEEMFSDIVCSALLLDDDKCLRSLSGPSLPAHYSSSIDGMAIGPGLGSCGTAAYTGKPVIVTDVETHPYWVPFKDLALSAGLRACWSTPILSSGKVLGTFAFYYKVPRGPSEEEERIVGACTHLCALAIERDQRVAERQRLAQTDALTQLPNRTSFNEAIARLERGSSTWGLLLADVDNLKLINDRFGHLAGDDLIRAVAERASDLGEGSRAFRLGGDEFAIIVDCKDRGGLVATAERLIGSMKTPVMCFGQPIMPSVTIGGDLTAGNKAPQQVHQNADYALYHAKERRRGGFVEYVSGLGSAIARRYRAIQDLSDALQDDRIDAFYQPIIDLASGQVTGLEALCRMHTRTGDVLAAGYFHEAMRDGQVAYELTRRMMDTVADDARRWLDAGMAFGRVCLNVSGMDLYCGGLCERLTETFGARGVPLENVAVEVTESVYLDQRDQTVAEEIAQIRAAGVFVALDDFGTGFASLTHLLTVPVDILKIDRSFVQRMANEHAGAVIIRGLIDIAQGLGIRVVAEGVETEEQARSLAAFGCQRGQGFLFARPLDRQATLAFLEQHRPPLTAMAVAG
ncbi:EAL domain-containing protein [Pseudomonas sp. R2.Fl]|nr:EAL domain-containing protein [Pseudomonas sp. R2.Fl]